MPQSPSDRWELTTLYNGTVMRVHGRSVCVPPCTLHHPSDHHMQEWPLNWRFDWRIMERVCPHGVGHPDPDDINIRLGFKDSVHGCDGCCVVGRKETTS